MWKAFIQDFHVIGYHLNWRIGGYHIMHIRRDPWVGCTGDYKLSYLLVNDIMEQGITYLYQIEDATNSSLAR